MGPLQPVVKLSCVPIVGTTCSPISAPDTRHTERGEWGWYPGADGLSLFLIEPVVRQQLPVLPNPHVPASALLAFVIYTFRKLHVSPRRHLSAA